MLSYKLTTISLLLTVACGGSGQDDNLFTRAGNGSIIDPSGATGGSATETGGTSDSGGSVSTGGSILVSAGGTPQVSTGGRMATGGSPPSTGGKVSTGGAGTGGARASGGSPPVAGAPASGGLPGTGGTPAATGGSQSTGGTVATGGSETGGNPQCEPYTAGTEYAIGDVAQLGTAFYVCTGPACSVKSPQQDSVYGWRKTSCGDPADCACSMACNAPIVGFQKTSNGNEPFTAYPEYLAAIETGWIVRVQRADSCTDTGQCLYVENYSLMRCIGTDQECRDRDPRFEHCDGILGAHYPCVPLGLPSPWEVLTAVCP